MLYVATATIFGLMTVGLSFAAEHFGDNMVQLPLTIWGAASSPILGAFILGFFFVHTTGFVSIRHKYLIRLIGRGVRLMRPPSLQI